MKTFSVVEQIVTDPVTGASIRFEVDPVDSSVVHCRVYGAPESRDAAPPADYLWLTFQRNGLLSRSKMVDAEAEEDARLRAAAQGRLNRQSVAPAATDEDRKAATEAQAKQAADDKALLDSAPKESKYAVKPGGEPPVAGSTPSTANRSRE